MLAKVVSVSTLGRLVDDEAERVCSAARRHAEADGIAGSVKSVCLVETQTSGTVAGVDLATNGLEAHVYDVEVC